METIKCNSCGAVQEFKTEDSSCGYCGEVVEIQKAAEDYTNVIKGKFGNFLLLAETAEEATNYDESTKYYNKILEQDTTYADAWLGKGNGQIYASKIGDIKMKEALTYWRNAIKFSENKPPMKLRVGKEINNVVQTFFPNLLNHYNEFSGLADSYSELAGRFLVLEGGISYAADICPDSVEIHQTGYNLCNKVITAPGSGADAAAMAAGASAIFNALAGNKYAAKSNSSDWTDASARKEQIKKFGAAIEEQKNKYHAGLVRLGVIDESAVDTSVPGAVSFDSTNIDIKAFNKLKTEYFISIVLMGIWCFSLVTSTGEFMSFIGPLIFWFIYYFARINPRSKKLFGAPFGDLRKSVKAGETNNSGNSRSNSSNNGDNSAQDNNNKPTF